MNIQFGTGVLYGFPTAGNLPSNPTPYRFGVLQEAKVDFKSDLKKLYGQQQFALVKARGKIDVSVKAKLAVVDPNMLNQLFFAQTGTAGMTLISDNEAQTVPAGASLSAWQSGHAYVLGSMITDGANAQLCKTAGASGSSAPAWKTAVGAETADNTVVWTCLGRRPVPCRWPTPPLSPPTTACNTRPTASS